MLDQKIQFKRLISAVVAVTGVVVANLIAAEPADVTSGGSSVDGREAIPASPAPITGVTAPKEIVLSAEEAIVVPPIHRTQSSELPPIDLESIRERARAWIGDGLMAAPTTAIEVAGPEIDASATVDGLSIEVPALVRPELKAPPEVR